MRINSKMSLPAVDLTLTRVVFELKKILAWS